MTLDDLESSIVAQTEPVKGSLFYRMQNQNEAMTQHKNDPTVRSAGSSSSMGKRLLSKFTDKARKIKSSGML